MASGITGNYNKRTRVLTVTFRNGTYQLPEVPPGVAAGFMVASSKGKFWNDRLKGRY